MVLVKKVNACFGVGGIGSLILNDSHTIRLSTEHPGVA
jgi:hypothetical protein